MRRFIGNFGGNSMMVGNLDDVDVKIEKLFVEGGENVYGLEATLGSFDVILLCMNLYLTRHGSIR
ncbi:hypothetical protein [Bacteroides thetaiotaomicron]|uniref:hypothetical protein n=1 Tax=Bacteroides thetaiotaomicron TaxID=818 RepID=UPI002165DADE|nr:hypothetical protein [Bacteroides thetaiotaomicron]MCS2207906.1 hypothetical protein [Bacteroides thetaiotaomicron]